MGGVTNQHTLICTLVFYLQSTTQCSVEEAGEQETAGEVYTPSFYTLYGLGGRISIVDAVLTDV